MANPLKPEKRTYAQDRFDILINKQRSGQASFDELTELDEIINRYPGILSKILEEMEAESRGFVDTEPEDTNDILAGKPMSLVERLKKLVGRLFCVLGTEIKSRCFSLGHIYQ